MADNNNNSDRNREIRELRAQRKKDRRLEIVARILLVAIIVLAIVLIITLMIRRPLTDMVRKMQEQETIPPAGVEELRYVTRIYNSILEENRAVS